MKRKYLLMGCAIVLVLLATIGGTLAALNTDTEDGIGAGTASITTKSIGVTIEGTTEDTVLTGDQTMTPGGSIEVNRNISNDTTDGYDIYVKVTIYKYWVEQTDNNEDAILSADGTGYQMSDGLEAGYGILSCQSADKTTLDYVGITAGTILENDWLVAYEDAEQLILYYTKPIAVGEKSTDFMNSISFEGQMDNEYAGKTFALEMEVDAVQANNSEDAIAAEWGTFPLFDEDGNLLGVYETEAEKLAAM